MKFYMFRTVRLSIIRSLFTVHSAMVYVIQVCRQLLSRTRMVLLFGPTPQKQITWKKIGNSRKSLCLYYLDAQSVYQDNGCDATHKQEGQNIVVLHRGGSACFPFAVTGIPFRRCSHL